MPLTKTWFGRNGSVRREGDGSSGIVRSVLSREVSAVSVYMLRRGLKWKTSVWLTRTLSYCLLVLQPPPGSVTSSRQAWSVPCLQPSVVLPSSKRTFWLTKKRFSLVGGWSWHACLPRSRPQHPPSGSKETNVLNTAHLLMWRHTQPYMYAAAIDRKCWQFKSIYGVL